MKSSNIGLRLKIILKLGNVFNARIRDRSSRKFMQPMDRYTAFFGDKPVIAVPDNQRPEIFDMTQDIHGHSLVKLYYRNKQNFTRSSAYAYYMNDDAKNLSRNLRLLMDFCDINQTEVASKAGVSQKTISNMLNPGDEKSPQLGKIEMVAKAFGLQTWHLLLPNCPDDLICSRTIEKLVENYMLSDSKGRDATLSVSEIRALYIEGPKTGISNGG